MLFRQIFDPDLAQYAYLLACRRSKLALLVDPQRDVDRYLSVAKEEGVEIVAVAETHIHADFLSGARELRARVGAAVYLSGEGGADWGYRWPASDGEASGGDGAVTTLTDGDRFSVGSIELLVMATPGHTPEHLAFLVSDRAGGEAVPVGLITGDFLLVGDLGRPDLLELAGYAGHSREESARQLFGSLRRLEALEDHLQVWPAHGAGSSCGKSIGAMPTSTLGFERRQNRSLLAAAEGEEAFVKAILADQPTPPTYFGRMKQTNRDGPPLLGRLPRPRRLSTEEVSGIVQHGETLIVDARPDRQRFMATHLPGSLYAPIGRTFSTAVGAVIVEESRPIVLVTEEAGVERLVRDLVRMGYDRVVAFCDESTLNAYLDAGGEAAHIPSVTFADLRERLPSSRATVVDVRDHFEFEEGHVPGAVSAPHTRLPEYLDSRIPPDGPLVVHCESGARSAIAAAWLAFRGREVVYVDDHWDAWEEAGGEVERGGAEQVAQR